MGYSSTSAKTNTMAVVSLVTGLASWFFLPTIGAIVAIITGHLARRQIKDSLGVEGGDGLAVVGLILGYLNLAMSCLGILLVILMFGGVIGLSGCAILADSASYVPGGALMPPLP
ncbi:MAG: hypothetical protein Kow0031_31520 [Anaerolineae bacterium]